MAKIANFSEYLGWSGAVVSLVAYALNTQQFIGSGSLVFLLMNAFGCSCLIFYTFRKGAFANTVINSIYLLLTLSAIGINLLRFLK
ncbi:MAG TPA: hypothetical protein VIL74_19965 [Pyrinomonadaceae bacterium]|jgi:hypothetical protein